VSASFCSTLEGPWEAIARKLGAQTLRTVRAQDYLEGILPPERPVARKKKAAKKAVRKTVKKTARRKPAKTRTQPETLRLRTAQAGYTVNDIERSVAFYRDVLGFVVGDEWKDNGRLMGAELRAGAVKIWLGQDDWKKGKDRVKGEGVRLYFDTVQKIDDIAQRIKSRGGQLSHEPETQSWGTRDIGITDPDGYRITIQNLKP
jgi:lactoylglutathione lyase